jgi:Kae1-associated kinase Bud32
MRKVLSSGAEATIYIDGANKSQTVDKERSKKNYRHNSIDETLRKARTRKESKILHSLEKYGFVPKILKQDEYNIIMEYVDGVQLKKAIDKDPKLALLVGKNLTIMHDNNIIHGDLTTSNMLLTKKGKIQKLYFIDFGLSYTSTRVEDMAVDIHLFKQALESKHYKIASKAYIQFIKGYNPKNKKEILERLEIVEQRGRYKEKT